MIMGTSTLGLRIALRFIPSPLLAVTVSMRLLVAAAAWALSDVVPAEWMRTGCLFLAQLGAFMAAYAMLAHAEAVFNEHLLVALKRAAEPIITAGWWVIIVLMALFVWRWDERG